MSNRPRINTALEHLNALADEDKARRYPNAPHRVKANYSDKSANGLTHCIVDWFAFHTPFSTRLQSTGTYRADLQKFVPSQQRPGMPDVFAVVDGRAVFAEVKIGADRLSDVQKATISDLIKSGASVYVARDFQGFYDWYVALFPALTDADALPFGPTPHDQD